VLTFFDRPVPEFSVNHPRSGDSNNIIMSLIEDYQDHHGDCEGMKDGAQRANYRTTLVTFDNDGASMTHWTMVDSAKTARSIYIIAYSMKFIFI